MLAVHSGFQKAKVMPNSDKGKHEVFRKVRRGNGVCEKAGKGLKTRGVKGIRLTFRAYREEEDWSSVFLLQGDGKDPCA